MPRLILFDDETALRWEPFALTRPVGELLFGTMTLRARAERIFSAVCQGHLSGAHLIGFEEAGAPPVLDPLTISDEGDVVLLLSRFVPEWHAAVPSFDRGAGAVGDHHGNVVGWYFPGGTLPKGRALTDVVRSGDPPRYLIRGTALEHPWDLIARNPDQITADVQALFASEHCPAPPEHVHHWGEYPLIIDSTAVIEPMVALDTSEGPIWIDRGARVRALTRLAGPAYVGTDSILLGGTVESVSLGPVCRVRGELAESVCVGYVNKQHDGHIGHAYLGRWVNLGAETTNSDLKNNYGTIRVWTPGGPADTGLIKMGSLIGDHVKTGIGLLLNTGTVVGAGSNVYGSLMPPTYVPPFSWGSGTDLVEYRLEKFLEVAERSMARRHVELSAGAKEQLTRAWQRARGNPNHPPQPDR